MAADELVRLVEQFEQTGVEVWLDGGWGVDALLGEQTRDHDDVDLIASLKDAGRLIRALCEMGYEVVDGDPPTSFVLLDDAGHQVDVHPVAFSEAGDGIYRMRNGEDWVYPSSGFGGVGRVLDRQVKCLSPEAQVRCHADYDLDDSDYHDLRLLHLRFGVAVPPEALGSAR